MSTLRMSVVHQSSAPAAVFINSTHRWSGDVPSAEERWAIGTSAYTVYVDCKHTVCNSADAAQCLWEWQLRVTTPGMYQPLLDYFAESFATQEQTTAQTGDFLILCSAIFFIQEVKKKKKKIRRIYQIRSNIWKYWSSYIPESSLSSKNKYELHLVSHSSCFKKPKENYRHHLVTGLIFTYSITVYIKNNIFEAPNYIHI